MGVFVEQEYELMSMEEYERKARTWELKFCFLPRKCMETNKFIWLKFAYRGSKFKRYDTDLIRMQDKWMLSEEFIVLRLMDKI